MQARDHWGYTALHEAAAKNKYEICKLLIESGAKISARNRENQTPFDLLKDKEGDLADLLQGNRALLDAAKKGDLERVSASLSDGIVLFDLHTHLFCQVKKLVRQDNINCQDEQGRNSTPLHLAAGYNHVQVAEYLIQERADVNAKDKGGLIPLHNASSYGVSHYFLLPLPLPPFSLLPLPLPPPSFPSSTPPPLPFSSYICTYSILYCVAFGCGSVAD